jgi:hypothetical protein
MKILLHLMILALLPFITCAQGVQGIDEIAPYSEGLAAVRKGNQWGFINTGGDLVIDFRSDLAWQKEAVKNKADVRGVAYPRFKNGRCMIQKQLEEEKIVLYGFIDNSGKVVIEPEYLNLTEFEGDYALGILFTKTFRGENNFQLRIYDYKFSEVVLNTGGEIMRLIEQRNNIQMTPRRYTLPEIHAKILANNLLAVRSPENKWTLLKVEL